MNDVIYCLLFLFLPGGPWQRFLKKKFQVQWRLGLTCGGISVDSNVDHWRLVSQQTQQMIHSFNVAKSIQSRKSSKRLNIYTFRQIYAKKVTGTLWHFLCLCNVWKSLKKASFWKNASEASKFYFQNEYIWIFKPNPTLESTSDILIIFCNKVDFLQRFIHISIY